MPRLVGDLRFLTARVLTGMGGDHCPVVGDLDEAAMDGDLDDFARQPPPGRVAEAREVDAAVRVDPAGDASGPWDLDDLFVLALDDLELGARPQPEALDRRLITDGLVRAFSVVSDDPLIEGGLCL